MNILEKFFFFLIQSSLTEESFFYVMDLILKNSFFQ